MTVSESNRETYSGAAGSAWAMVPEKETTAGAVAAVVCAGAVSAPALLPQPVSIRHDSAMARIFFMEYLLSWFDFSL